MPTHLDYIALKQRQDELAQRAERVRQEREGLAPAPARRGLRFAGGLFTRLRPRQPAEAPASTR